MTIIPADLLERCARAAYEADRPAADGDWWRWELESDAYREVYRTIARAVLTEALQPTPDHPGPLDGQEPLIEETT